ncbi:MAG: hypothetical protein ABIZ49_01405, partial [Opitutaceae bacterium]
QPPCLPTAASSPFRRAASRLPFEMGENDLWIAATGLYHGLRLVTRDNNAGTEWETVLPSA